MTYGWISFLTDYGTEDGFVAACHGVIATTNPAVRVLDITHQIPPQDVRRGAAVLAQTAPYLPVAVHLGVVDPGVGTARRGVLLVAGRSALIGPDNGLLPQAAIALGGVSGAYELTEPRYRLPVVSATFHGRDVFAPAAAHLAAGAAPEEFGPRIDPDSLVRLPEPRTVVAPGELTSEVLGVDRFGNLQLAAPGEVLAEFGGGPGDVVRLRHYRTVITGRLGTTFADVPAGTVLVHVDSAGHVAIAVNGGSAAEALGGRAGEITISL